MLNYDVLFQKGVSSGGEFFEDIIEATYTALLKRGDVVMDCGANVGRHTIPLSRCVGLDGRVLAFEPTPILVQKLVMDASKNVWVFEAAIGSENKDEVEFFVASNSLQMSSIRNPELDFLLTENQKKQIVEIKVRMLTLNAIYEAHNLKDLRFIKMDIEGAEFSALKAADKLLIEARPMIVFECGFSFTAQRFNYSKEDFFAYFQKHGYKLYDLFGRSFVGECWDQQNIPWYLIAVPIRSSDEQYMMSEHIKIVSDIDTRGFLSGNR